MQVHHDRRRRPLVENVDREFDPGLHHVRGRDLSGEVMGQMSFSDLAFLLASGRTPTKDEAIMFDAVLVSLADHGLTPTALAARLTYTGAPEALQGAIAAGLLGGGSVFLGPVEDTARFLDAILDEVPEELRVDEVALSEAAANAVRKTSEEGRRIPVSGIRFTARSTLARPGSTSWPNRRASWGRT